MFQLNLIIQHDLLKLNKLTDWQLLVLEPTTDSLSIFSGFEQVKQIYHVT